MSIFCSLLFDFGSLVSNLVFLDVSGSFVSILVVWCWFLVFIFLFMVVWCLFSNSVSGLVSEFGA